MYSLSTTTSTTDLEIFEDISPKVVKQGVLENCWVISSIAALSSNPKNITRLFLTKDKNKGNFYVVKFFEMGKWKNIILDDYFPCMPLDQPIFSYSESEDLWVLILEKAYAKKYGSYAKIERGHGK